MIPIKPIWPRTAALHWKKWSSCTGTATATRYIAFRSQWFLWSRAEKTDRDSSRTACHNSLIVKFNQLARYLRLQGHKTAWRETLGYEEEDPYNRKRIGDFGCYLAFVNSLCAR